MYGNNLTALATIYSERWLILSIRKNSQSLWKTLYLLTNYLRQPNVWSNINPSSRFYLLSKIHKVNNSEWPIVSACSCPAEHISKDLDVVMRPLVQSLHTYVNESTRALNLTEDINQIPKLWTKVFSFNRIKSHHCIICPSPWDTQGTTVLLS